MNQQHTIYTNLNTYVSELDTIIEAFHKRLRELYPCVDDVTRLPHNWSPDSKAPPLGLTNDKLSCYYRSNRRSDDEDKLTAAAVKADHCIPPSCLLYYFEIKCCSMGREGVMGIGLTSAKVPLMKLPGWSKESYGYHADDGNTFSGESRGRTYGPKFEQNDVIGCGYNLVEGNCFFTRNGLNLGKAFDDIPADLMLYPTIGLKTYGEEIQANFGQEKFVYDIEQDLRSLRKNMTLTISDYPISDFNSWQTSLHKLVQSWLVENSYPDTAEAFTRAAKLECKENLQRVQQRGQIQQSVLSGKISEAIRLTDRLCPNLLKNNPNLLFALKCRQFIELISGAENDYQPIFTYANNSTTTTDNTATNGLIKSLSSLESAGDCDHYSAKNNGCNGANNNSNFNNGNRVKKDNHQQQTPILTSSSSQDPMDVDQPAYSNNNSNHRHNGNNNHSTHIQTQESSTSSAISSCPDNTLTTATATSSNAKLAESNGNAQNIDRDLQHEFQAGGDPELDSNEEKYTRLIQFGRELSEYSQQLDKFYGKNEINERMLQETIGLIAYIDPKRSYHGKLLDPKEREPLSQLLNNFIVKAEKDDSYRPPLEEVVDHLRKLIRLNNSQGKWLVDRLIEQN